MSARKENVMRQDKDMKPKNDEANRDQKLESADLARRPALRLRTNLRAGASRPLTGFYA